MDFSGNLIVKLNVVNVKTFDRKSGEKGQEVVVTTDNGYRCQISAPDVSVVDLTSISGICDFEIEPIFNYDKFVSSSGNTYGKNFPSFKIKNLLDIEID